MNPTEEIEMSRLLKFPALLACITLVMSFGVAHASTPGYLYVTLSDFNIEPGTVQDSTFTLGTYLGGADGSSGSSPANDWAYTLDPAFDASAADSLDHRWIQSRRSPAVWDLSIPSNGVIVFPSIDHGPMEPMPYEAVEFTAWGSNDPSTAGFPSGWELARPLTLYSDGWIDSGGTRESDDFTSEWTFGGASYRYIAIYANYSIRWKPPTDVDNECRDAGDGSWCSDDYEIDAVGRPDTTGPSASCTETVNPHGEVTPPAGSTTMPGPYGGQNEDGFYKLGSEDDVDQGAEIFARDSGSGTVWGPFGDGTNVKYTQAPGAAPAQDEMGGNNAEGSGDSKAVAYHLTGTGDLIVYAEDAAGNRSGELSCLVPPPPK
jgi:hypothetical protein